jgi:hypothetical protein
MVPKKEISANVDAFRGDCDNFGKEWSNSELSDFSENLTDSRKPLFSKLVAIPELRFRIRIRYCS